MWVPGWLAKSGDSSPKPSHFSDFYNLLKINQISSTLLVSTKQLLRYNIWTLKKVLKITTSQDYIILRYSALSTKNRLARDSHKTQPSIKPLCSAYFYVSPCRSSRLCTCTDLVQSHVDKKNFTLQCNGDFPTSACSSINLFKSWNQVRFSCSRSNFTQCQLIGARQLSRHCRVLPASGSTSTSARRLCRRIC
jgi:hypothetical protein